MMICFTHIQKNREMSPHVIPFFHTPFGPTLSLSIYPSLMMLEQQKWREEEQAREREKKKESRSRTHNENSLDYHLYKTEW